MTRTISSLCAASERSDGERASRALAVGDAGVHLDAAVDRAGVHHQSVRLGQPQVIDLEAEQARLSKALDKLDRLPAENKAEIEADIQKVYETQPPLAMVDSRKGITNLHVPNNIIVDASMPNVVRDGGKMWNKNDELQDCIAMVPDRCYATMYAEILEDAKRNGQFDPATMGNVANVGLMAQKAEEYGSHDKTFEAPAAGTVRVVDAAGAVLLLFRTVRDLIDGRPGAGERARVTNAAALAGAVTAVDPQADAQFGYAVSLQGDRALVGGLDVHTDSERIRQNIGYMSQLFTLYTELTAAENIRFYGQAYDHVYIGSNGNLLFGFDKTDLSAGDRAELDELGRRAAVLGGRGEVQVAGAGAAVADDGGNAVDAAVASDALAAEIGLDPARVKVALDELAAAGLVEIDRKSGKVAMATLSDLGYAILGLDGDAETSLDDGVEEAAGRPLALALGAWPRYSGRRHRFCDE